MYEVVKDDFQYGQVFVRDECGIDNGMNVGFVCFIIIRQGEIQQVVNFILVENVFGIIVDGWEVLFVFFGVNYGFLFGCKIEVIVVFGYGFLFCSQGILV